MAALSGLDRIRVTVASPDETAYSGNALAVLHEIARLLERFLTEGVSGMIDLSGLPLTPADYELLREALAQGEVHATIDAIGPTEVRETLYPGVWWVTHHNVEGDVVADLIEVTGLPEILKSQPEDVREGLKQLREFLSMAQ